MKKKYFFTLAFCATFTCLFAQKHDYIWLHGYDNGDNDPKLGGAVIDFNHTPPKRYSKKLKTDLSTYIASCSDSSGHLMFYTNGIALRDTSHNVMQFGDTINPGKYWERAKNSVYPMGGPFCFALPTPGKKNHYSFFHIALDYDLDESMWLAAPLYHTLVDMEGNNGLGKVVKKNQILLEKMDIVTPVAVKHGNGRD